MSASCKLCRFFDAVVPDIGDCRRYPPHANYGSPQVLPTHWCGEFSSPDTIALEIEARSQAVLNMMHRAGLIDAPQGNC
jgi:hypothetical protein